MHFTKEQLEHVNRSIHTARTQTLEKIADFDNNSKEIIKLSNKSWTRPYYKLSRPQKNIVLQKYIRDAGKYNLEYTIPNYQ